ncbi:polysaccharide deacetylase family protein [Archangium lipolyticum]|uniref:polysaccharide deacetylase family protein n=1 Tax=Archangium lipolyticum TaxID=2970465 RepID=UPI00214A2A24|nr:polysaccharide deacetylase family protein [Archangium lipolyticum]
MNSRPSSAPLVTRLLLTAAAMTLTACATTPAPATPMEKTAPAPEARPPLEVAITFDDLPSHGPEVAGITRAAVIDSLVATLRKHGVPPVTGFVNGSLVEQHPEQRALLEAWLAGGQRLGNHTWSHVDLGKVGLASYLEDVDRNEPLLRELVGAGEREREWKVFRYPFLQEGVDLESRNAIRSHLLSRGYRIGQVTIDFGDWAFNEAYARCVAAGNTAAQEALRKAYRKNANTFLRWADAAGQQVFGRRIRHILLLHAGALQAATLDELLTAYKKAGVRFISLDEAMEDPIYAQDPGVARTWGDSFIEQVIQSSKASHPPFPLQPLDLLEVLCR